MCSEGGLLGKICKGSLWSLLQNKQSSVYIQYFTPEHTRASHLFFRPDKCVEVLIFLRQHLQHLHLHLQWCFEYFETCIPTPRTLHPTVPIMQKTASFHQTLPAWYSNWARLGWSAPLIVSILMFLVSFLSNFLSMTQWLTITDACQILHRFISLWVLSALLICLLFRSATPLHPLCSLPFYSNDPFFSLLCSIVLPVWTMWRK